MSVAPNTTEAEPGVEGRENGIGMSNRRAALEADYWVCVSKCVVGLANSTHRQTTEWQQRQARRCVSAGSAGSRLRAVSRSGASQIVG